uniref:WD_REPEATS_REGION domain-containing protein n=1 Tax=Echinostoma caproni TaxID=27848 RepID=A0A183A422_9TREM
LEATRTIVIPPLPRVVRGKPVVFGADPKGTYLLYPNGNSVDPSKNDMYTQHSGVVHVAKYSPSGFYVASADKFGKIRIWDTVNEEHILKNEFQPFVGPVCDLAWTSDNQRIIVGGTGQFGAVFNAETGASVGEIMGVSRNINSVDFRPVRPYRAVTGNDEGLVTFFEGPPFIFNPNRQTHRHRFYACGIAFCYKNFRRWTYIHTYRR